MQPEKQKGKIIQIIKLKSELNEDEILRIAREREPQFRAIPGLLQKYYVKTKPPYHVAGIYVWDSMESLKTYRESDLAACIPKAYKLIEPPDIEIMEVMFQLRE